MAYVPDKYGNRTHVPGTMRFITQPVVMAHEDCILRQQWLIAIWKSAKNGADFVVEYMENEQPSTDQILYYLAHNNISRYEGYATVQEVYVVDWKE